MRSFGQSRVALQWLTMLACVGRRRCSERPCSLLCHANPIGLVTSSISGLLVEFGEEGSLVMLFTKWTVRGPGSASCHILMRNSGGSFEKRRNVVGLVEKTSQ